MASTEILPTTAAAHKGYVNVADRLAQMAERMPLAVAVACPGHGDVAGRHSYDTCTFAELERDATALARGLVDLGVTPGIRLVLLVKPGIEFVKLVFALLRSGATAVLIDPGMGKRHLVNCLAAVEPQGFVAISLAQAVRTVLRSRFPKAKLNVTVGRRWFWGGMTYRRLLAEGQNSGAHLPQMRAADPAAIIFTSGSTGPPKGVLYTHQIFETQVTEIQREYDLQPGGADLACFALFGLFNSALGVTTVFPTMDFSRPASANPRKLLDAASDWQVTQAFASPAVWNKLSSYCQSQGEQIPTLRKIFSCGAPVSTEILRRTLSICDAFAEMHTPYGATESLPVATIAASEVLAETAEQTAQGAGVCVGKKFESIEWRIIRIADEAIPTIADTEELPVGDIGELIVRGPQVSPLYISGDSAKHNALAKIANERAGASSPPINPWHRMGDVGYLDAQGRFWYCGRKNHRVETSCGTLFTECVEAVFNSHPLVERTALVGIGRRGSQMPVLFFDTKQIGSSNSKAQAITFEQIQRILQDFSEIASLHDLAINVFVRHDNFPVDVRHNSKINREQLAKTFEHATFVDP